MYTIKCKLCDCIIGKSTIPNDNALCGMHTPEEFNNILLTWDIIREQRNQMLAETDWINYLILH